MATRRTPDGRQRRRELCDAGIRLLAEHGAKGLSHPRVDRQAGVPDGSASYYFRTRAALIHAVAERVAELDLPICGRSPRPAKPKPTPLNGMPSRNWLRS
ncbi:TetR/AcrR family transcriptional regulator [Mycolicibacterium holsaticum]|uniref:TetR/AcrR family transcriptional regulator n=1 Tax=Mycolicibacterium holsaticum TaxID=152142 RepID=UPI0009FF43BB|nr:TetR family transcriptional regulator [Mycolicibacterium holsaticum]